MDQLWPDDDETEEKLKNLAKHLRGEFERNGLAITVRPAGAKIWLAAVPD